MAAQKQDVQETAPTAPVTSCSRKKFDQNAGFVENVKDYMNKLIHAPMEEHKACLKASFTKMEGKFTRMIGKFGGGKSVPVECENSVPPSPQNGST